MASLESLSETALAELKKIVREEIELENLMQQLNDILNTPVYLNHCIDNGYQYLHKSRDVCCLLENNGVENCCDDAILDITRLNELTKPIILMIDKSHCSNSIIIKDICEEISGFDFKKLRKLGSPFTHESYSNILMLYDYPITVSIQEFLEGIAVMKF